MSFRFSRVLSKSQALLPALIQLAWRLADPMHMNQDLFCTESYSEVSSHHGSDVGFFEGCYTTGAMYVLTKVSKRVRFQVMDPYKDCVRSSRQSGANSCPSDFLWAKKTKTKKYQKKRLCKRGFSWRIKCGQEVLTILGTQEITYWECKNGHFNWLHACEVEQNMSNVFARLGKITRTFPALFMIFWDSYSWMGLAAFKGQGYTSLPLNLGEPHILPRSQCTKILTIQILKIQVIMPCGAGK